MAIFMWLPGILLINGCSGENTGMALELRKKYTNEANKENKDLNNNLENEIHAIKHQVCVLVGYPGAGKGTMAQSLDPTVYKHLSLGDALREEVQQGTQIGLAYKDAIEMNKSDKFVPEEVLRNLLDTHITKIAESTDRIILDGYPKTIEQAIYLEEYLQKKGMSEVIVYVDTDKSLLIERVSGRQICSSCCKVYNKDSNPPKTEGKCDVCTVDLFSRGTDTEINQRKRIEFFDEKSTPLIEYYKTKGLLLTVKNDENIEKARDTFHHILKKIGFPHG